MLQNGGGCFNIKDRFIQSLQTTDNRQNVFLCAYVSYIILY